MTNPDGSERHTTYGLHGKIANIPASFVAVHAGEDAPHEIVVEGHVEESKLFAPQIRMMTRVSTTSGSKPAHGPRRVRQPARMRPAKCRCSTTGIWSPYLEEGARFVAPVKAMALAILGPPPRSITTRPGRAPEPGLAEQCYFFELQASRTDGRTAAMRSATRRVTRGWCSGISRPSFRRSRSGSAQERVKEGYVTGLEPGTNYPNPKPFEKASATGRHLLPHGRYVTETTLEVLSTGQAVAAVEAEIQAIQAQARSDHPPHPDRAVPARRADHPRVLVEGTSVDRPSPDLVDGSESSRPHEGMFINPLVRNSLRFMSDRLGGSPGGLAGTIAEVAPEGRGKSARYGISSRSRQSTPTLAEAETVGRGGPTTMPTWPVASAVSVGLGDDIARRRGW